VVDDGDTMQRLRVVGVAADMRHLGLDHTIENDLYYRFDRCQPSMCHFSSTTCTSSCGPRPIRAG
jgi:hypothetical protein